MNKYKEAKYEIFNSYNPGAYFQLEDIYKKDKEIVKICFMKYKDDQKALHSIFKEFLKYHELYDPDTIELIIMLGYILDNNEKKIFKYDRYNQILENISKMSTFSDYSSIYKSKVCINYFVDRELDFIFKTIDFDFINHETVIEYIYEYVDSALGEYLINNKNILNKYIKLEDKKKKLNIKL